MRSARGSTAVATPSIFRSASLSGRWPSPMPRPSFRRTDTSMTHFVGFVAQWSDTIHLAVEDQYGNPVSNVPVTFQVLPLQLIAACAATTWTNPIAGTPRSSTMLVVNGDPRVRRAPGPRQLRRPEPDQRDAYRGTFAGVIEGDVVAATYTVEAAADGPPAAELHLHPELDHRRREPGLRHSRSFRRLLDFLTDEDGRNVNAAGVGRAFDWPIDFWIEFYEPKPRDGRSAVLRRRRPMVGGLRPGSRALGDQQRRRHTADPRSIDLLLPDIRHHRSAFRTSTSLSRPRQPISISAPTGRR